MAKPKLITRKPTGQIPWPLILVEGPEKSGKSWSWAQLTASQKIGRAVAIIIGESDGDQYISLPGADYELAVHDGTYTSIRGQVEAAVDELSNVSEDGRPNLLVVDSLSNLWTLLCNEAQQHANARAERKAAKNRQAPPTEDVDITMDLWNKATNRWRNVMDALMGANCIVVATARGREIVDMDSNGRPSKNRVWKVEGQKMLCYDVDVWVRTLEGTRDALLVGARSVKRGINPASEQLLSPLLLEKVIFDLLECGTNPGAPSYTPLRDEPEEVDTPAPKKEDTRPAPPAEPVDHSSDEHWQKSNRHLHVLISRCGLSKDAPERVREMLKAARGVESFNHLEPNYLGAVVEKLRKLSGDEGPDGELSPRAEHIISALEKFEGPRAAPEPQPNPEPGQPEPTPPAPEPEPERPDDEGEPVEVSPEELNAVLVEPPAAAPQSNTEARAALEEIADLVDEVVFKRDGMAFLDAIAAISGVDDWRALSANAAGRYLNMLRSLGAEPPQGSRAGTPSPRAKYIHDIIDEQANANRRAS